MDTAETIRQKVHRLPPAAQREALDAVEQIEQRYQAQDAPAEPNGTKEVTHPLTLIARLAVDAGVTDLAERHDFYAHGKLEG
ncbi:MAG: hypothetical protein ACJ741_09420 [Pyrinomonadaceae bacterium]